MWVCAIVTVIADQATKQWALFTLASGERIPLLGNALGLQLIFNPGAAFSFAENATIVFSVVAAVVVVAIPVFARNVATRAWAVTLGAIWGGAAGNLVDRLFRAPSVGRGHVIDFLAYGNWFIGNVADIALVVGVCVAGILMVRGVDITKGKEPSDD